MIFKSLPDLQKNAMLNAMAATMRKETSPPGGRTAYLVAPLLLILGCSSPSLSIEDSGYFDRWDDGSVYESKVNVEVQVEGTDISTTVEFQRLKEKSEAMEENPIGFVVPSVHVTPN